jgi:hypothetical protein
VRKKVNLPLFADPVVALGKPASELAKKKKPSIDAARARLGVRISEMDTPPAGFAPGVVVTFALARPEAAGADDVAGGTPAPAGPRTPGVVVFASRNEVHVLLDGIRLRRLPPSDLLIHEGGDVAIELEKIAGDARLFGQLVEGQAVRYADGSGNLVDGKVVEKCRWGALVRRDDGAVVAVGFRKLWPSSSGGAA